MQGVSGQMIVTVPSSVCMYVSIVFLIDVGFFVCLFLR